jgi:hypothetical protein
MKRLTFYALILISIVAGYVFLSKSNIFDRGVAASDGLRESFEGESDDDDEEARPDALEEKCIGDKCRRDGLASAKKKKKVDEDDDAKPPQRKAVATKEDDAAPVPAATRSGVAPATNGQLDSLVRDVKNIKDMVAKIAEMLEDRRGSHAGAPAFEAFYAMNYA